MNATFLVTFLTFVVLTCNARPQSQNGVSNIPLESDVDYQDYQQYQAAFKLSRPHLIARPPKARSPVISSVPVAQNKVTPPVPILKQINRHNEDGSYTYGFEGADGSFKIETKFATGEVIGKYGYVDDSGKTRVVEYGANKYGFQPAGEGITVPPATITNEGDAESSSSDDNEQDRQQVSTPKLTTVKISGHKRKAHRFSQGTSLLQQQQQLHKRPKPQHPSTYLVQELEEGSPQASGRPEAGQPRQLITPADINSLQNIFGGDLHNVLTAQYQNGESISQTSNESPGTAQLQDEPQDSLRPALQSFPIPTIFEVNTVAQKAQDPNELAQSRYISHIEIPNVRDGAAVRNAASRNQIRGKSRPQFLLISSVDDAQGAQSAQSPTAVRRYFGRQENKSILDELWKQYAIPNMAAPINNFSFGSN